LRSKLGNTEPALQLESYNPLCHVDKSGFGMWVPEFASAIYSHFPERRVSSSSRAQALAAG